MLALHCKRAQRPSGIELVLQAECVRQLLEASGRRILCSRHPHQNGSLIGTASLSAECAFAVLPQNLEGISSLTLDLKDGSIWGSAGKLGVAVSLVSERLRPA